jgi:S1-C subfamily serine protease
MADTLQSFSDALVAVVEKAGASVVTVDGRSRLPASGIAWAADGVIVTANHVVQRDEDIRVGLPGGEMIAATLVGRDPASDIAVLRVDAGGLVPATWADSALKVGQVVLALGRPGTSVQADMGMIGGLLGIGAAPADEDDAPSGRRHSRRRSWFEGGGPLGSRGLDVYIRTGITMYPGFSGGALVDAGGRAIGMNTSALMHGTPLTLPASVLRPVVGTLLEHGHMRQGYLGVGSQPVRLPDALAAEIGQSTGVLLVGVEPDSPAAAAGLLLGDTIVALDGAPVRTLDDLLALLSGDRVGRAVPVRIVRGGQLQEVTVTIGERA